MTDFSEEGSTLTALQIQRLQGGILPVVASASTIVFNPFPAQIQTLCPVCQKYVCGDESSENWKMHVEGRSHQRALAVANNGNREQPLSLPGDWFCDICNKQLLCKFGDADYELHVSGEKHLRALKNASVATETAPPAVEPQSSGSTDASSMAPAVPLLRGASSVTPQHFCSVCEKMLSGFPGDETWRIHVLGGPHVRAEALQARKQQAQLEAQRDTPGVSQRETAQGPSWFCDVCNKTLLCRFGDADYQIHVTGEKHLRAERIRQESSKLAETEAATLGGAVAAVLEQPGVVCVVCEVTIPGLRDGPNWAEHISGVAHKRKLRRLEELFPRGDHEAVIREREALLEAQAKRKKSSSAARVLASPGGSQPQVSLYTALQTETAARRKSLLSGGASTSAGCTATSQPSPAAFPSVVPPIAEPQSPVNAPDNSHLFISIETDTSTPTPTRYLTIAHLSVASATELARGTKSGSVWWLLDSPPLTTRQIYGAACSQVGAFRPDIISLQHVELSSKSELNTILKASCPDKKFELTPQTDLFQRREQESGATITCVAYSKARFQLVTQRMVDLESAVLDYSGVEFGYSNAVFTRARRSKRCEAQLLCLVLQEIITQRVYVVASCELPHQPHLDEFRAACIREAHNVIFSLAGVAKTRHVVMLGDFGCPPSSLAYRHLTDLSSARKETKRLLPEVCDSSSVSGSYVCRDSEKGLTIFRFATVLEIPIAFIGEMHTLTTLLVEETFAVHEEATGSEKIPRWTFSVFEETRGCFLQLLAAPSAETIASARRVEADGRRFVLLEIPGLHRFDGTARTVRFSWLEAHQYTEAGNVNLEPKYSSECVPTCRLSPHASLLVQGLSYGIRSHSTSGLQQGSGDSEVHGVMRSAYAQYRSRASAVGTPQISSVAPSDSADSDPRDPFSALMKNVFVDLPPSEANGIIVSKEVLCRGNSLRPPLRLQNSVPYAKWQRTHGPLSTQSTLEPWFTMMYPCSAGPLPVACSSEAVRETELHRFEWQTTDYITYCHHSFKLMKVATLPSASENGELAAMLIHPSRNAASSHLPLCAVLLAL